MCCKPVHVNRGMNVSCDPNISHLTSPLLQDYSTMHNVVRATLIGSPWTLAQSSLTGLRGRQLFWVANLAIRGFLGGHGG